MRIVLFLLLVACSESTAPTSPPTDAGTTPAPSNPSDSGGGEVTTPGRTCAADAVFGAPTRIMSLNTENQHEFGGSLSADLLQIYFSRLTLGQQHVYVAKRPSIDEDYAEPTRLAVGPEDGTRYRDPFIAPNGDLYFGTNDTLRRAKPTRTGFDTAEALALQGVLSHPSVGMAGSMLCFTVATGTDENIHCASLSLTGEIGTPAPLEGVNTAESNESHALLSEDGKTLYFSSTPRTNFATEMRMATRSQPSGPFGASTNAPFVNAVREGTTYEAPTYVSPDGCTLYFNSGRSGAGDIYRATR